VTATDYRPAQHTGGPDVKRRIDFDSIRRRFPLEDYIRRLGVRLRRSGGLLVGKCPIHREQQGAAFSVDPETQKWRCWGKCDRRGDVIDLEQALGGGTLAEAAKRLGAQPIRLPQHLPKVSRPRPAPTITEKNPFGLPYRITDDERRVSVEAAERLVTTENAIESIAQNRGWKPETIRNLALEPSLGLTRDGRLAFLYESGLKIRWKENGERRFLWQFGKNWFWRGGYIQQSKTVWISEGETDCIWLVDRGFEEDGETAIVALPGAAFTIDPWAFFFSDKRVVLCPDNDEAGSKCLERLTRALKGMATRIDYLDWRSIRDP
jgi:hypothetical protein